MAHQCYSYVTIIIMLTVHEATVAEIESDMNSLPATPDCALGCVLGAMDVYTIGTDIITICRYGEVYYRSICYYDQYHNLCSIPIT